ncbi:hypothetical protein [Pontibacter litorisediminis]|uniref:hypothetical protein n=1 Tax=Pontibacter litorisediminis TaxID=1846260 RepID=UPI0023EB3061|nr:hypothetical protein [Pontibacter litorisediminis]
MEEDQLNELKHKALAAAHAYWKEYVSHKGDQDSMLTWVRNDVTGEMLCLTKGAYTNELSSFISKLH